MYGKLQVFPFPAMVVASGGVGGGYKLLQRRFSRFAYFKIAGKLSNIFRCCKSIRSQLEVLILKVKQNIFHN